MFHRQLHNTGKITKLDQLRRTRSEWHHQLLLLLLLLLVVVVCAGSSLLKEHSQVSAAVARGPCQHDWPILAGTYPHCRLTGSTNLSASNAEKLEPSSATRPAARSRNHACRSLSHLPDPACICQGTCSPRPARRVPPPQHALPAAVPRRHRAWRSSCLGTPPRAPAAAVVLSRCCCRAGLDPRLAALTAHSDGRWRMLFARAHCHLPPVATAGRPPARALPQRGWALVASFCWLSAPAAGQGSCRLGRLRWAAPPGAFDTRRASSVSCGGARALPASSPDSSFSLLLDDDELAAAICMTC